MNRTAVKSSMLQAIGYDPTTETLEVQYHDKNDKPGDVWAYAPVPASTYGAMLLPGASIGAIFNREVKANPLIVGTRVHEEVPSA
jgi:hypothetical protein